MKGKVLDSYSKTPLAYASAYINGTTLGTYANDKGEFEIRISLLEIMNCWFPTQVTTSAEVFYIFTTALRLPLQ
ncbi:MAG: carboxypeptidase-like regulatory domain-containing protein [Chryseolinea sp.]